MKTIFLFLATLSLAATAQGCGSLGCTEIGCSDGVNVSIANLASKFATSLPITIELCAGKCLTARITDEGGTPTCEVLNGEVDFCNFDSSGVLSVTVPVSTELADSSAVTVSLKVTDAASATLFEAEESAPLQTSQPNGDGCEPTCHNGLASFSA